MKVYDKVKLIKMRKEYEGKHGSMHELKVGEIGTIWSGEIRDEDFEVFFEYDGEDYRTFNYILIPIKIMDLELVEDGHASDETVLDECPSPDPRWWCKVEDGYIMNLLGEKKNKIPYDYKS